MKKPGNPWPARLTSRKVGGAGWSLCPSLSLLLALWGRHGNLTQPSIGGEKQAGKCCPRSPRAMSGAMGRGSDLGSGAHTPWLNLALPHGRSLAQSPCSTTPQASTLATFLSLSCLDYKMWLVIPTIQACSQAEGESPTKHPVSQTKSWNQVLFSPIFPFPPPLRTSELFKKKKMLSSCLILLSKNLDFWLLLKNWNTWPCWTCIPTQRQMIRCAWQVPRLEGHASPSSPQSPPIPPVTPGPYTSFTSLGLAPDQRSALSLVSQPCLVETFSAKPLTFPKRANYC